MRTGKREGRRVIQVKGCTEAFQAGPHLSLLDPIAAMTVSKSSPSQVNMIASQSSKGLAPVALTNII